jgi:excinuclease ABC subunit B
VVSSTTRNGDQPTAIAELVSGVRAEERDQVLLGVTGSGKTFTMAKVIEAVQKPPSWRSNKTPAAQLRRDEELLSRQCRGILRFVL